MLRTAFLSAVLSFSALAQTPPARPAGISSDWEVENQMKALSRQAQALAPLLEKVSPEDWTRKGAPQAYVRQLRSSQAEMKNLVAAAGRLSQEPARLSAALETYFRMENMERLLASLREGIRKYQDPALSDQLGAALAANMNNRDRLRQHIQDVAAAREEEFKVVNDEAQRCRVTLTRQPVDERRRTGARKRTR
ncbi:MAG: hypothetical protein HYZ57_12955 [Acidobacteria bacterium]|nr:hypothetical protein [Acidobacteriota bacterium]MBI3280739.1 hypothetical protein [Acidobacteriota bacterium]